MYVLVGLPGTGKTTRARELELERQALRLTPDEWMIPLFGEAAANGKRDVLEGRLVARNASPGVNVILDFGVWGKDERSALRSLAAEAGANCELVYLPVDELEQRRGVEARFATDPESTFEMRPEDLQRFRRQFEVPDHDERTSAEIDPAPAGYRSWRITPVHSWRLRPQR